MDYLIRRHLHYLLLYPGAPEIARMAAPQVINRAPSDGIELHTIHHLAAIRE
ncbi:hypothetical protein D3C85_1730440 [compost metagenome]